MWLDYTYILAFDSWESPEAVSTAIIAIIGALTTSIVTIIGALRRYDRKRGKTHCRITGKELKQKKNHKDSV